LTKENIKPSTQTIFNMKVKNKLIRVYTGTEVSVILLRGMLEEFGVPSIVKNDYKSGIDVGFVGGVQSAIDLFIQQFDFEKAEPIIREFTAKNQ
jgi:hypothetical protein